LFGSGGAALYLAKGFMEDFSNVKESNDVTVFIADRL